MEKRGLHKIEQLESELNEILERHSGLSQEQSKAQSEYHHEITDEDEKESRNPVREHIDPGEAKKRDLERQISEEELKKLINKITH